MELMMINLVSSFSSTICFVVFILILLLSLNTLGKRSNLPPGPWELPIIGGLHHLATTKSLPHQTLHKLSRTYGPLMHLKLGQVSTYIISSPQAAESAIKTHDLALSDNITTLPIKILSYNLSDIIFTPYGDHWRQIRKFCVTRLLSSKKVMSFQPIREQEVSDLIAFIRRSVGSPVNLSCKISSMSINIICRVVIGVKLNDQDSLLALIKEALALVGGFNFTDFFPSLQFLAILSGTVSKSQNIHNKTNKLLDEIIKKHRDDQYHQEGNELAQGHEEDVIDVLLRLQRQDELELPITDNTIKAVCIELFAAGTDTSSSTIEWAMTEMIKNPRVMKKAQSELRLLSLDEENNRRSSYLGMVIKETLRLHPPIPLFPKECKETCEINGYVIPSKSSVFINVWAIGRDPEFWNDAESFIPERFEKHKVEFNDTNYKYIPFGGGRRVCPGISFSMAVIELTISKLLCYFDWELPHGLKPEEIDMSETFGLIAAKKKPLHLIPNLNATQVLS